MNTMPSGPVKPGQMRCHDVVFALALGKADQRHIMSRGEVVDVGDDLPASPAQPARWRQSGPAAGHSALTALATRLTLIHEEGRTGRFPRVLTDER
jgi:hypothetical protein